MKKILNNDKYGKLTIVKQIKFGKNPIYLCKCTCGTETEVWGSGLCSKTEGTKSCGCLQRLSAQRPEGQAGYNVLYRRYKTNAKNRKLLFDITLGYFIGLTKKECNYCGRPPMRYNPYMKSDGQLMKNRTKISADRAWILVNGIDRVDSKIGYTQNNCTPCCQQCNYSKLDYSVDEFIAHCLKIVRYNHL